MNQWVDPKPVIERVMPRILNDGECWLWTGFVDKQGYGRVRLGGRTSPVCYVHRVTYEHFVGEIPNGFHIDHLCRVRRCANPAHLEAVPPATNLARGMSPPAIAKRNGTCLRGHPKTPEHWNGLQCGTCRRERVGNAKRGSSMSTYDFRTFQANSMTEKELQESIRRLCKALKLLYFHDYDSRKSASGFPDCVIVGRGGVLFRELKTETGKLTDPQRMWLDALVKAGEDASVWTPRDLTHGHILTELQGLL